MNPYRQAFYQRQAEWHQYGDPSTVRDRHETRADYYQWYTRGWLPPNKDAKILDIACGSGQFLYFLNKHGYHNATGIDIDKKQVAIGQAIGLNVVEASVFDHLNDSPGEYDMIAMLDIIEHFTREELFPLMELVVAKLRPGGRLIASVPNAASPNGLQCVYADITHEIAFTEGSLKEMLFCHGLTNADVRDPWPAPIGTRRRLYRWMSQGFRSLESLRLRALGLEPPRIWSNVMWVKATK